VIKDYAPAYFATASETKKKVDFCKEIEHTWSQNHFSLFYDGINNKERFITNQGLLNLQKIF
jgi:hypothetical protein